MTTIEDSIEQEEKEVALAEDIANAARTLVRIWDAHRGDPASFKAYMAELIRAVQRYQSALASTKSARLGSE